VVLQFNNPLGVPGQAPSLNGHDPLVRGRRSGRNIRPTKGLRPIPSLPARLVLDAAANPDP